MQMDVLAGLTGVAQDRSRFILPKSKRLITEAGVYGDNSDVMSLESEFSGRGYGGVRSRIRRHENVVGVELRLDVVIFDDGLCVGSDEFGLVESVIEVLEQQRSAAQQVVEALRNNASRGHVFEIVRPLANRARVEAGGGFGHLLRIFARRAIDDLVEKSGPELAGRFEHFAQASALPLHRPSSTSK